MTKRMRSELTITVSEVMVGLPLLREGESVRDWRSNNK